MTHISPVSGADSVGSGASLTAKSSASLGELRAWAALAIGSLGTAGVFAVLLAVSRIPGIEAYAFWPLDFFAKGLVIHVVFSLIVWFLTLFALLVSLAAREIEGGLRFGSLGSAGAVAVAISYPLLFLTAFDPASEPSLNNYIPVIQHPAYYAGLALLALGILLPVLRLLSSLRVHEFAVSRFLAVLLAIDAALELFSISMFHFVWLAGILLPVLFVLFKSLRPMTMPPLTLAMVAGSVIYLVALLCFGFTIYASWGTPISRGFNEVLFWGGGHILQFLFCLIMLTGWFILSRSSLGEKAARPDVFRIAILMLVGLTLAGPFIFRHFDITSLLFREAFSKLQFAMVLPTLVLGGTVLFGVNRARRSQPLPWRDPAFLAFALSMMVFGIGGVMGNVISGSDTRTPAHYHAVIAGVNLAAMGLFLTFCLPALQRELRSTGFLRLQIWLYGIGQFVACIGLFWAGGYGAPRKTAGDAGGKLLDGAFMGMYLHGIGALFAVAGGVLFVITVARALWPKEYRSVPA